MSSIPAPEHVSDRAPRREGIHRRMKRIPGNKSGSRLLRCLQVEMSLQEAVVLPVPLVGAISTPAHGLLPVIPEDG